MHSKQWHYSLHRDFQNCYSTRRSLTGFFSSNSSSNSNSNSTCAHYITLHYTTIQRILHPEYNSTCRRQRALRVLLLHYRGQRDLHSRFQKRNSTHRRQDLLEIHPCVLQDIPDIPAFPGKFYKFYIIPVSPGNLPHSSILRLECIFYSSIGFQKTSPSTS